MTKHVSAPEIVLESPVRAVWQLVRAVARTRRSSLLYDVCATAARRAETSASTYVDSSHLSR